MSALLKALGALGGPSITITNRTVSTLKVTPTNAEASYSLEANGDITIINTAGSSDDGDWVIPKAAAGANYECRATILSGSLTTGTTGSWLGLGSNRTWNLVQSVIGTSSCQFTLEIRLASSGLVLASVTITLNAEVTV